MSFAFVLWAMQFLSTLSLRRATYSHPFNGCILEVSIHALLAESDILTLDVSQDFEVSIHALLAESDATRS